MTCISVWALGWSWGPSTLAVLGGLHGLAWVLVEYLDGGREPDARKPRRGFTRLYFGLMAFGLMSASEVWSALLANV